MTSKLKITTQGETEIRFERMFHARRDHVFHAYHDPGMMKLWYGSPDYPVLSVDNDFRQGGQFRIVWGGKAENMIMTGTWLDIDAPRFVRSTENWAEDWTGGEVINAATFSDHNGGTLLVLVSTYSSAKGRDGALEGASEGFAACLDALEALLGADG